MTGDDLGGFSVAITADRRRDEQAVLLERLGVEVLMFPLLQTEAEDLGALRALTDRIAAAPPDYLLANTGYGMRTWFGLSAQWGSQEALVGALKTRTTIATRGAKALGELRKVGLDAWYRAPGETLEEVVDRLLQEDLAGKSVVFQLHGEPSESAIDQLREAGAQVTSVPVYKMGGSAVTVAQALVRAILNGLVDAVTFTAAPQVHALARSAEGQGLASPLLAAFNAGGVTAVCIGDVCAAAATAMGIWHPLVPEHPRLGSLATTLGTHLSERRLLLSSRQGPARRPARLVKAAGEEV